MEWMKCSSLVGYKNARNLPLGKSHSLSSVTMIDWIFDMKI